MNGHLSSEQVSRWMIGDRAEQEGEHVQKCPECAARVAELESAIALFRECVRDCGESYGRPDMPLLAGVRRARRNFAARPSRWAPGAAALLLLAAIPIYTNSRDRRREAEMARADAALLEQVDAGISRAVPAPMEPLVKLVMWNSGSGNQAQDKAKTGEIR
jgi:hypothetical protein